MKIDFQNEGDLKPPAATPKPVTSPAPLRDDAKSPEGTIMARIADAYPRLTQAHRRMADFVLKHPFQAATMMIDELAQAAGISAATANRFARVLGADGYPAFRTELARTFGSTLAPIEKLRVELQRAANIAEIVQASIEQDIRNLQTTLHRLVPASAENAAARILAADRVFTLGFGTSGALANFAADALAPYCPFVQNAAGEGGAEQAVRRLLRLGATDAVIGIALPRYSKDTIDLLSHAHERGATVIAITDSPASPAARDADIVFSVGADHGVLTSSGIGAYALLEALSAAVARQTKNPLDAATEFGERVLPYLYVGIADGASSASRASRPRAALRGNTSERTRMAIKGKRK